MRLRAYELCDLAVETWRASCLVYGPCGYRRHRHTCQAEYVRYCARLHLTSSYRPMCARLRSLSVRAGGGIGGRRSLAWLSSRRRLERSASRQSRATGSATGATGAGGGGATDPMRLRMMRCRRSNRALGCEGTSRRGLTSAPASSADSPGRALRLSDGNTCAQRLRRRKCRHPTRRRSGTARGCAACVSAASSRREMISSRSLRIGLRDGDR